jgi:hypothetical protein
MLSRKNDEMINQTLGQSSPVKKAYSILHEFDLAIAQRSKPGLNSSILTDHNAIFPENASNVNKSMLAIAIIQTSLILIMLTQIEDEYVCYFEV